MPPLALLCLLLAPEQLVTRIEEMLAREAREKRIPVLCTALVDGEEMAVARCAGEANAKSLFRPGSVSKLFTDIAIMRLVERGELDLDAPVPKYAEDFRHPVTLRQLMSHRAGLTREPPVGHYFDPTSPPLAATVHSLNETDLLYPPGRRTKYSNAGIGVAGYVLERRTATPFLEAVERAVLEPLGMRRSEFRPLPDLLPAWMWTYDGRVFEAPRFPFGFAPAGDLTSNLEDMSRFIAMLHRGGAPLLRRETLESMWQPQYAGSRSGLGFVNGSLDGKRTVGHGGAVYGFATDLTVLPDQRLGAITFATKDSANPVSTYVSHQALRWALAARAGKPLVPEDPAQPVPPGLGRRLDGRYGSGASAVDVTWRNGHLYLLPLSGGQREELRLRRGQFVTDGLLGRGETFSFAPSALRTPRGVLPRMPRRKPAPVKPEWEALIGEYGWDHNILYLLEWEGKLYALIEWYDYYPLEQTSAREFRFPDWGLYQDEDLTVTPGGVNVGWVFFPRRKAAVEGGVFRVEPRRPVAELMREALAAKPPAEKGNFRKSDLVDVAALDRSIRLDIRYAGADNFLGTPVYPAARALLQRPAAEALLRAHRRLRPLGYGLLVHDAYRPWHVTKVFYDATPEDKRIFVANPAEGSRHNRGCAVDLTLYELATGKPAGMPGVYDEMSERSYPDYPGGTASQRWHRDLLRGVMEAEGFTVFDYEWWHFDYRDWNRYAIGNAALTAVR